MSYGEILTLVLLGAWVMHLILAYITPLIIMWVNTVFRVKYDVWKYADMFPMSREDFNYMSTAVPLMYFLGCAMLGDILETVEVFGYTLQDDSLLLKISAGVSVTGVVLLPILSVYPLRWLVDVARNLRIKRDTGDSVRLQEMQKQIDELTKAQEK